MKDRENHFFELAIKAEALLLGDFTLKAGRKSPYFFNISALFESGFINELSTLYADLIEEEVEEVKSSFAKFKTKGKKKSKK